MTKSEEQSNHLHSIHEFLRVLANETKQRILCMAFQDNAARSVGEVAEIVGIGLSTASEYLADMRRAGILKSWRVHKEVFYQPDQTQLFLHLEHLVKTISSCCCWDSCHLSNQNPKNGTA